MSTYRADDSKTDENFIHTDIPQEIEQMQEKTAPADADVFVIEDSAQNWYKRKLTWANIKAAIGSVTGAVWGNITGTLSNQTDLQNALNGKANTSHTHQQADVQGLTTALQGKLETVSNTGGGVALARPKVGTDVPMRSLIAGSNVSITQQANTVTISATGGGGGGVTDHGALTGLGDDDHPQYLNNARGDARYAALSHNHSGVYEPVFSKNTAFNKNFGTTAGTVAEGNHTHTGLGGEANTSSNAGTGVGLALPKSGVDLPFKSLKAGSGVTLTDAGNEVTIAASGGGGGGTPVYGSFSGVQQNWNSPNPVRLQIISSQAKVSGMTPHYSGAFGVTLNSSGAYVITFQYYKSRSGAVGTNDYIMLSVTLDGTTAETVQINGGQTNEYERNAVATLLITANAGQKLEFFAQQGNGSGGGNWWNSSSPAIIITKVA